MPNYIVNDKSYFFVDDITQEEAEERVNRAFGEGSVDIDADEPSDYNDPEDEGAIQEIAEGFGSGLLAIPQGLTETFTTVFDLAAGTDYTSAVTQGFNNFRNKHGIDPAGAAGKITEGLVQFGLPGLGAAAAVSKFSKIGKLARGTDKLRPDAGSLKTMKITKQPLDMKGLSKSQKLGLAAQQFAAAGAVDAIVATDGTQSLGDFFEGGYGPFFATSDLIGLDGREKAAARMYNKVIAHGLTGSILAGVLPPVLGAGLNASAKLGAATTREIGLAVPGAAIGAGAAAFDEAAQGKDLSDFDMGKIATGAVYGAGIGAGAGVGSRVLRAGSKKTAEAITKQEDKYIRGDFSDVGTLNTLNRAVTRTLSAFRYRSFLPPDVARMKSLVNPAIEGDIKIAEKALKEVDRQIERTLKSEEFAEYQRLPDFTKQKLINNFMDVLEGAADDTLQLPKPLLDSYLEAKQIIDDLSNRIIDTGAAKSLPEVSVSGLMSREQFREQVTANISNGGYLSRQYEIFNNELFKLPKETRKELVKQIVDGKGVDIKHVQKMLAADAEALRITDDYVTAYKEGRRTNDPNRLRLSEEQAQRYIDNVTNYYKQLKDGSLAVGQYSAKTVPIVRLNPAVLNKSKVDNEIIRTILGEVRNPKEAYMHTVAELSNFIAADAFYSNFKRVADDIIRATPAEKVPLFVNTNDLVQQRLRQINTERTDEAVRNGQDPASVIPITRLDQLGKQQAEVEISKILESVQGAGGKMKYVFLGRDPTSGFDPEGFASRSVFGEMYGYAIPKPMYEAMSNVINESTSVMGDIFRGLYYPMVKLKGISQYAKTILSPITQVRNVTSASLFALAQGNVGKNASLFESMDLVLRDLIDKELKFKGNGKVKKFADDRLDFSLNDEVLDFLVDLQNRGVIGSSAQLREIQANLRQGLGYRGPNTTTDLRAERRTFTDEGIQTQADNPLGGNLSDYEIARGMSRSTQAEDAVTRQGGRLEFPDSGPMKGIGKTALKGTMNMGRRFLDTAEGLYKGGDDVWKIYNYAFELQKLRNAKAKIGTDFADNASVRRRELIEFGKHIGKRKGEGIEEAMKRAAADTVRNTVPNYELVPEFIKGLRGVPLGNFIAFPAEILRTGFNTLDVAAKELESPVQSIREIGMKRLMGGITAFGLVGPGLQKMAQNLTDTSDEELEAANRLAASWQRNSQLIPVGKDDNGNFEFIDFSHTNPYDLLSRGYRTVLNSYNEGKAQSKDFSGVVTKVMFDSLSEYMVPFLDYSMVFSALFDSLPTPMGGRGGRTRSGAKVYREQDTRSVAFEKSLLHMFNTIIPGGVPVRIPIGADLGIAGGNFQPVKSIEKSRFLRGVFSPEGEVEPSTGKTYQQGAELFRAFTGLNTQTLDLARLADFRAQEFKQNRSGAATLFNEVLRLEDASPEQILEAYSRADDARLRTFRKYAVAVDDLSTLGLSPVEIRTVMKDAQLGKDEINSILNDRYIPFQPSKEKLKDARNKKNLYIPMGEINALRATRRGMSLREEEQEEVDEVSQLFGLSNQLPVKLPSVPPTNVARNTAPSFDAFPEITQTASFQPNIETRTNPNFLGSNPDDILKNLDIARRTG